jgi:hypothetical protein
MPPKAKPTKKGANGGDAIPLVPGRVVMLPRPNIPSVDVAHPASLPSFLAASSLFVLASHSKCNLVGPNQQQNQVPSLDPNQPTTTTTTSPRGGRTTTPRGGANTNNNPRATPTTTSNATGTANAAAKSIKNKDGHDQQVDFYSAIPSLKPNQNSTANSSSSAGWNLQVSKKSIFLCDDLIGELDNNHNLRPDTAGTTTSTSQNIYNNNNNQNSQIDFDKLSSFFAASSGRHGLVVVRDENNNQRVFAGGMNEEGQLPLPISTSASSVVADTKPVPFKELKNLEFRLGNISSKEEQTQQQDLSNTIGSTASNQQHQPSSIPKNSIFGQTVLRPSEGALVVSAACGSAHTVVLVRNNPSNSTTSSQNNNSNNISTIVTSRADMGARRRALMNFDTWQPSPSTFLFGCGRKEAIGECSLPPNVSSENNNNNNSTLFSSGGQRSSSNNNKQKSVLTPLEKFKMDTSPRRAVPPEENCFRHLGVGDGEDFDALWAYGDLTFARGRRGLVCFGTVTSASASSTSSGPSSTLKFHSPTQALVVIPAPLGCLVKEVIVLNAVAGHARKIYAFLEDTDHSVATTSTSTGKKFDEFDEYFYNISNSSSSTQKYSYLRKQQNSSFSSSSEPAKTLFDGTRLLEIHTAFPSGHHGDLKMLNPPPPIFSFADVTEKIFGPVASNLRRMGAPLFRLKKLTCGSEHAVAVTVDGAVIGFGSNYFGQLGDTGGGSDQGPKFADESLVGPRTARMYPNPDCSSVSSRLQRQYYESAILLRPPSLKRSPLIIAQAYAQHKGRTVEFNDVVSVVPIPERGGGMMNNSQNNNSSMNSSNRDQNNLSPTSEDSMNSSDNSGGGRDSNDSSNDEYNNEDEYEYENEEEENGSSFSKHHQSGTSSPNNNNSNKLIRKGTAPPKSLSLAAAANRKGQQHATTGQQQLNNSTSGTNLNASENRNSFKNNNNNDGNSDSNNNNNNNNKMRAVMNPSWPVDTVVDCCCGPLFTTLMQCNAELVFLGDHVPFTTNNNTTTNSNNYKNQN